MNITDFTVFAQRFWYLKYNEVFVFEIIQTQKGTQRTRGKYKCLASTPGGRLCMVSDEQEGYNKNNWSAWSYSQFLGTMKEV